MKYPIILTPNKDISMGVMYSDSHYSIKKGHDVPETMSVHEQRVIVRAIEIISEDLKGVRLKNLINTQVERTTATWEFTLPIKDTFLKKLSYDEVQQELDNLFGRHLEYEDKKKKIWWKCSFIEHPKVNYGEGTFSFGIYKGFAEFILNFNGGFKQCELNPLLRLPTVYAQRFYIRISGDPRPFNLKINELKEWLNIPDEKYRDKNGKHNIANIENRILKPSKQAIDDLCPWSFTYSKEKKTNNPKSPVIGFEIKPFYQADKRDQDLEKRSLVSKVSPMFVVDPNVKEWLESHLGFTNEDFQNLKQTIVNWQLAEREWQQVSGKDEKLEWLQKCYLNASTAQNGAVAWMKGAMVGRIDDLKRKNLNNKPELDVSPESLIKPFLLAFNNALKENNSAIPAVTQMSQECKERFINIVEKKGLDTVLATITYAMKIPFLNGIGTKNGWKANLTYMLKEENFDKIMNGNFDYADNNSK